MSPLWDCITDAGCRAKLSCAKNCDTVDAEEQQRCFIACVAANPNDNFTRLSACAANSKCVTAGEYKCPVPKKSSLVMVTQQQVEGVWYVIRGLSRTYDCWSCQKSVNRRINDTAAESDYVYTPTGGKPTIIRCTITAAPYSPEEKKICPGRAIVDYDVYGMHGRDNIYILAMPNPNYMLAYYCGSTPTDNYCGATVTSRTPNTKIPPDIEKKLNEALASSGLPRIILFFNDSSF